MPGRQHKAEHRPGETMEVRHVCARSKGHKHHSAMCGYKYEGVHTCIISTFKFLYEARNHIPNVKFLSFLMLAPTFFLSNTGRTKYFCRLEVSFPSLSTSMCIFPFTIIWLFLSLKYQSLLKYQSYLKNLRDIKRLLHFSEVSFHIWEMKGYSFQNDC